MRRRTLTVVLMAAALSSSLSACFPLLATGAVGATMVATDRRTSGAYVDDQGIEIKARHQVESRLPSAHVNITSYNRAVLMTGEVPSEAARAEAELIVRGVPNVRKVYNHTVVAPASGITERNQDTWITTKIRTNLLNAQGFNPSHVKVVTERGVTYVFGLVTQAEGEAAAAAVSRTAGVQKVVTLFEYIAEVQPAS
ncbi:BON domain-containing protein [Gulbenkiania mobilis]|uniref:Osmotically-inducible protein OsmY n=1 Tax=Gulbenkiania mobilis TaxID=397457 RepID=A0ABY2CXQ7_GULMO|nr:BON domain-containing protein [Gulbenkiania mobilis]TCW31832.1 osmotically-inducible protein OsmY [Gulbenkiania mobilis]